MMQGDDEDSLDDDFVVVEKDQLGSVDYPPTPKDKVGSFLSSVTSTVAGGATVVADNVKGRVAPNSVCKQGYLEKHCYLDYWEKFYIIFREGSFHVLTHPMDTKSLVSLPLSTLRKIERIDPLASGRPHCFKIILFISNDLQFSDNQEQPVSITTYSFFGMQCVSQSHVVGKEISVSFCAQSEEEQVAWIRHIDAAMDGLSFKEGVKNAGKSALNLAKAIGIATFVSASVGTVARRAGHRVANHIISP